MSDNFPLHEANVTEGIGDQKDSKRNLPERNAKSTAKQKKVMIECDHFNDDTESNSEASLSETENIVPKNTFLKKLAEKKGKKQFTPELLHL